MTPAPLTIEYPPSVSGRTVLAASVVGAVLAAGVAVLLGKPPVIVAASALTTVGVILIAAFVAVGVGLRRDGRAAAAYLAAQAAAPRPTYELTDEQADQLAPPAQVGQRLTQVGTR